MARITARQAFTRAKIKRQQNKVEINKGLVEARRRYLRQLSTVGIEVQGSSQLSQAPTPLPKNRVRRARVPPQAGHQMIGKKITDYFTVTSRLEFSPRVKQPLKTSSSFDPNGVECVTIYDSDSEPSDINNNNMTNNYNNPSDNINLQDIRNANHRLSSESSEFWDTSSESGTCDRLTMQAKHDIKPRLAKVDISNLGVSFEELQVKVRVDEDVEIVDMLPPIPLRKHEIFDVEGEEGENEQVTST